MAGSALYEKFMELHRQQDVLILPNAWDVPSALILAHAGFEAVGTSSAALSAVFGRLDGQHELTRDEHLRHAELLARTSGLLINGDFEDGYGNTPTEVAATVHAAVDAGLAGVGIEDTAGDPDHPIRDFDDAVARVRAAVDAAGHRTVITARADNHLYGRDDLDDTIRRLTAFADVGADVLYAPLVHDIPSLTAIVAAVAPKPVNVLIAPGPGMPSIAELQQIGIKRVSFGPALYANALTYLEQAADALRRGDVASATAGIGFGRIYDMVAAAS